ncbi:putative amino-acid-binding protein YxeM [Paraliobacillus ryukyuensis]|uniref:Amino acid ABC transporter substrate-binding protein (PAAT family) n=1 Tax=Paraliobacillus ryukyuensis TaxID=200904 RepID=A0A366EFH8_9BACI|nr:ectoine/hydroxyectoine ABC transporter substrate-binding protein EhuB [Paraliobacillus ryukyuensis]RBP00490.1 amino acid ABC transporter substrate-binding protein (PAAT family) [Paraliobacillus ryukyuensis]
MKKIVITLLLAITFVVLTACGSSDEASGSLEKLKEEGTVTVGFSNEAPYAYEEDGELKGAAVDIAEAVFAELGIDNVEGRLTDWSELIPSVQAGQLDAITAGMAIKPDRAEKVLFAEPDMQYGEGLIVESGNPLDLHSYKDIAANPDVTVVVMEGATEVDFLKQMGVSEDQIETAPDIPATLSAVESGRADATTGTEMTVKMAVESANSDALEFVDDFEQPDVEGVPSYGATAFSLENKELRDAFNEALAKLKKDGTVDKLLEENGFSAENNSVPVDSITTEEIINGEG